MDFMSYKLNNVKQQVSPINDLMMLRKTQYNRIPRSKNCLDIENITFSCMVSDNEKNLVVRVTILKKMFGCFYGCLQSIHCKDKVRNAEAYSDCREHQKANSRIPRTADEPI